MKIKIATKLLTMLLLTSLIPLSVAGAVGYNSSHNITTIASQANQEIAAMAMSDSTDALSQELRTHLKSLTKSVATDVNEILVRVEADTSELSEFATYLYNNDDTLGRYAYPSTYTKDINGAFGSIEENQNSWLMVSLLSLDKAGVPTPEVMQEIYLTEFMDIKFKSIAHSNPYAVQLYINTKSQITRGMPFIDGKYIWVNAIEQFPPDIDLPSFDFYYLADNTHNPKRVPVWTQLYWDPAGLGWMVSNVAPVYRGQDDLVGVVGIDITLDKIIDEVINVQVEKTGFAFLMSDTGQAIAFPERAADFLGFKDSLKEDFGNDEKFSFYLTKTNDVAFQAIVNQMLASEHDLTAYTLPSNNEEYFFAYHPIELTNWSIGIVVPTEEVFAPAILTNEKINKNVQTMSETTGKRSQKLITTFVLIIGGIVIGLVPISLIFSNTISNSVKILDDGSRRIGSGDLSHRISINSGDEIEELAKTFNQMATDLQTKVGEIEAANTELKKLDKLKSKFISMASHELRTPLIAIQGYIDLLHDGEAGEINKEQKEMLNIVSRNTTRLTRIVAELLDISRIEENKLVLRKELFPIEVVIREVVDEQQPSLNKRGHTLTMNIQPNLPKILGDRDRIAQVMINLLSNAIKYTPDGGYIEIKAQVNAQYIQVGVIDNGIGIAEEHIDHLFKRFSTIGDITKHKTGKEGFQAGGTGLGLSIVKGIIKAHGGQVWVESQYGQGSTFYLTLPITMEEAITATQTTDKSNREEIKIYEAVQFKRTNETKKMPIKLDRRLNLLVIDDEEDTLELIERFLKDNYKITTTQTSATGLKEAITNKPDLILLDAWMPGISGYDICKILKHNGNTKAIPVIIFTAATQKVDKERAYEVKADGFLTKPFRKDELIELIEGFRIVSNENGPKT